MALTREPSPHFLLPMILSVQKRLTALNSVLVCWKSSRATFTLVNTDVPIVVTQDEVMRQFKERVAQMAAQDRLPNVKRQKTAEGWQEVKAEESGGGWQEVSVSAASDGAPKHENVVKQVCAGPHMGSFSEKVHELVKCICLVNSFFHSFLSGEMSPLSSCGPDSGEGFFCMA